MNDEYTVQQILNKEDGVLPQPNDWLGFWRLVRPDGTWEEGWVLPSVDGKPRYQFNCFDGYDEAWYYAPYEIAVKHIDDYDEFQTLNVFKGLTDA